MLTKTLTALLLYIAQGEATHQTRPHIRALEKKDEKEKDEKEKVEMKSKFDVVVPKTPIEPADAAFLPETCYPFATTWDPQECPWYIEPFTFLGGSPSEGSARWEENNGKGGICIFDPLSATAAADKFDMYLLENSSRIWPILVSLV